MAKPTSGMSVGEPHPRPLASPTRLVRCPTEQRKGTSMVRKKRSQPDLKAVPMLLHESVYVGIDVGKHQHVAGFVSKTLLERYERFEACPALAFENSREGFRALIDRICALVPLEQVYILLEHTGHYHRVLVQYLQEFDLPVYVMPVQKRPAGMLKTDKRDALGLANHLYNQLELGMQLADKTHLVRRLLPPTPAALQLKGWMRHRYELKHEITRHKNKLVAICDELFPEFTTVLSDPNAPTALAIRERFPTPQIIASTPYTILLETKRGGRPTKADYTRLQQVASQSIGTRDVARQRGLVLEQKQLIRELRVLQEHVEQLDTEIIKLVEQAREGQILTSIPGIGSIQAAAIIAAVGNIGNFEKASHLKAYFGWAPVTEISGKTLDQSRLTHGGTRAMKEMLFLCVANAIQLDCEWARLYERLVPKKCSYDERRRAFRGRVKVIGRIAGQVIEMTFALLKQDAEILSQIPPGEKPPPPILYDPEIHQRHRNGDYRPLKNTPRQRKVIQLPERLS
jgi:transposase